MRNGYIYLIQLQSVSEKYELRVFDARQSISRTSKLCVVYILKLPIECYDIGLGGPNRQCVAGEVKQPPLATALPIGPNPQSILIFYVTLELDVYSAGHLL